MVCDCPTMPKRGVVTSTTRRSRSFGRPVISACTGAAKPSVAASVGTSCTRPSVMKIAPATRSFGTSVERRLQRREQARAVGLAAGFAGLDEAHLEIGDAAEPLGRARRAPLRSAWCGRRIPGSRSCRPRRSTTEVRGSRSSRVNEGLASASTNSASAAARTNAPRLREASSRTASTTATASADHTM